MRTVVRHTVAFTRVCLLTVLFAWASVVVVVVLLGFAPLA